MQIYRKYTKFFLPIGVAIVVGCSSTRRLKEGEYLLAKNVIIEKTGKIDKEELIPFIKQKPNRKLLDVYPFHLGVHNIFNEEKVKMKKEVRDRKIQQQNIERGARGKKLKSLDRLTFKEWVLDIGEAPVKIDTFLVNKSSKQLSLYLAGKGYFNNTVSDSVKYKKKKAVVYYKINVGLPYTINKVSYSIPDERIQQYVNWDTASSLIKPGLNYDIDALQKERDRITKNLLNLGFYNFSKEYIFYEVDSNIGNHKLNITLSIDNYHSVSPDNPELQVVTRHTQFYLNNIIVYPDYNPNARSQKNDTLRENGITVIYTPPLLYKPSVLASAVFLKKGELYKSIDAEKTYQRLSSLKAFKLINLRFAGSASQSDSLECAIYLTPVPKQSFSAEAQGSNTSGNLGISGSFVYQNRNLFNGLELLEIRLKGGVEAQKLANKDLEESDQSFTPFNTIEFGPEAKLDVPRFLLPFKVRTSQNSDPKTSFTSFFNYQLRPDYTRFAANIAYGYNWKETAEKKHSVNPLEITFVKVAKEPAFQNFLDQTNDLLILNSYTDHLVTATRYTFQYNNQDIKRRKNFTFFKANAEFSGNILRGIYNLAHMQHDADGSYRLFNIKFSQYLRMDLDYRHYFVLSPNRKIVVRSFAGVGKPLHNLRVLPFEKSFFAGGSNDIRAWRARSLGPGSFQSALGKNFDQIGDAQLELNLEYRFKVVKFWHAALFTDMGNIWLRKPDPLRPNGEFTFENFYKEFAVGSGVGIRADFSFFILRLDIGVKMRDPAFGDKGRWVVTHAFDKDWKNNFAQYYGYDYSFINYNFGIGYPF